MTNKGKYLIGLFLLCSASLYSKDFKVASPDNKITLNVSVDKGISWSVNYGSTPVITPSFVSLRTDKKTWGEEPRIRKSDVRTVNETIEAPVYKKKEVADHYKELSLTFTGNYALQFRVYDDGVAYRWISSQKGDITILSEKAQFNFAKDDSKAYIGYVNAKEQDVYACSFENSYKHIPL